MRNCVNIPPASNTQLPWSIKQLLYGLGIYFINSILIGALLGFSISKFNTNFTWNLELSELIHIIQTSSFFIIVILAIVGLKWLYRRGNISLQTLWGSSTLSFQFIILTIISGTLFALIWSGININLKIIPLIKHSSNITFYGNIVIMGCLGPLVEELYFRGMLYRALRNRCQVLNAMLIVSTVFAIYHAHYWLSIINLVFVFTFSLISTLLLERTGSLTASSVFHIAANLTTTISLQYNEIFRINQGSS